MKTDKYRTKLVTLERATFVGPYDEGGTVMEELHEDGWRIIRSGPYTNRDMHPQCDMTRFLFIVERETTVKQ